MPTKLEYTKPAKPVDELIAVLVKRGLIIEDHEAAKCFLSKVNYYRLSGYWFNYQRKASKDYQFPAGLSQEQREDFENTFVERVTFNNIVDIYRFDTKLRSLCLDALEKIEIACGSILCEHMCNKYGGYWFTDAEHVKDRFIEKNKVDNDGKFILDEKNKRTKEKIKIFGIDILKERFDALIKDNKKTSCISHFGRKYSNQYPPYWIMNTLITFGLLSKIYSSLKSEDQIEIAKRFEVPATVMEETLISLSNIRNICAHYGRLWNRYIVIPPPSIKFNKKGLNRYNMSFCNSHSFFPVFYIICFMLTIITPESKWCNLVNNLIKRYEKRTYSPLKRESLVSFDKMGFPLEWEDLPLFEKMLENK